jgi:hypothetical protein
VVKVMVEVVMVEVVKVVVGVLTCKHKVVDERWMR